MKKLKRKTKTPLLSVVMPVYNAAPYLPKAIDSVLSQTFKDFELIIVDDASTDASYTILQKYAKRYPKRIIVLQNKTNMKQAVTVTRAIEKARGEYIARMDADDISLPTRFEKQIEYLKNNPKTVAIGTQCTIIDVKGKVVGKRSYPESFDDIYKYIFKFCPVLQPTFMIARKRLPYNFEYFGQKMNSIENVELLFIFRLFKYGKVENLSESLLKYRVHNTNTSLKNIKEIFVLTLLSRIKSVISYGYKPNLEGILSTFAQALIVLLLPQQLTFKAYNFARNFTSSDLSFSPFNLNFKSVLVRA